MAGTPLRVQARRHDRLRLYGMESVPSQERHPRPSAALGHPSPNATRTVVCCAPLKREELVKLFRVGCRNGRHLRRVAGLEPPAQLPAPRRDRRPQRRPGGRVGPLKPHDLWRHAARESHPRGGCAPRGTARAKEVASRRLHPRQMASRLSCARMVRACGAGSEDQTHRTGQRKNRR